MLSRRWAYVYSFERKQFSHWVKSVVLHWTNKNRLNDTCERREEGQSGIRRQTKVFDLILFGFYSEPFEHVPFHYMHNASIRLSWAAAVGEREWTASSVVDGILSVQDKIECVACWNVNRISPAHRSLNFSSNFSNIVFSWNERFFFWEGFPPSAFISNGNHNPLVLMNLLQFSNVSNDSSPTEFISRALNALHDLLAIFKIDPSIRRIWIIAKSVFHIMQVTINFCRFTYFVLGWLVYFGKVP